MAHEKEKLAEAHYFYGRMSEELHNRSSFVFNLSAFLSSARSVLQFANKEAKLKSGGHLWFDNHMNRSPILSFFKAKRDINIHEEPVKPLLHAEEILTGTVHFSGSLSITHFDATEKVLYQSPSEIPEPKAKKPDPPAIGTTRYRFTDWKGSEDVMTLSGIYLNELCRVVEDGIKKTFLTG